MQPQTAQVSLNELALIGNGTLAALIDGNARVVWCCFPGFDGDPAFCSLMRSARAGDADFGHFSIDVENAARNTQEYERNTAVLRTVLHDGSGGAVEVVDFAPRYERRGRMFAPMMLVRQLRPLSGNPRVRIRLQPARGYGRESMSVKRGADHNVYSGDGVTLRLTSNAPMATIVEEKMFALDGPVMLILGADETVSGNVVELGERMLDETVSCWREWAKTLTVPSEWEAAVIRAAITLKLNVCEDTGAIVAAVTTSIPEAPGTGRNWDYRYSWLRDACFVVNALGRLGDSATAERYVDFMSGIIARAGGEHLKPMYGITGGAIPQEREVESLDGYRGMGPVRVGNQASQQLQHDVFGAAILSATPLFIDSRAGRPGEAELFVDSRVRRPRRLRGPRGPRDAELFARLEPLGLKAAELYDKPDAGIWELRGMERVHTFSSVMCWAGCDRLAAIAEHIGLGERAEHWRRIADEMREVILKRSWNDAMKSLTTTMDGGTLDASLLLLHDLGFIAGDDPRFAGTVVAIERELRRGNFISRYTEKDHIGVPDNAFVVCTFWYINALAATGREAEARALFENILACRNAHGLLAEDIDPETLEQWGNCPQTYSMAGIIDCAMRLSRLS